MTKLDLRQIPIDQIQRGRYQPRYEFDQEALEELAASIKSAGLLQPIVVRPIKGGHYEIIAGERRWRASQRAGIDTINCIIKHYSDEQAAEAAMIENINRVDLNPIEVANAYQRLINEFDYSHDEVAAAVGKSRVKITNSLRLLKLDNSVQELIIEGRLSEGHGKVLAVLAHKQQIDLAKRAIARGWSVRKIEQEIKKIQTAKQKLITKKDPDIKNLEKAFSDHIGCKTDIEFDEGDGMIKIHFHNIDILDGVFSKMGFTANVEDKGK
ncbi:MAG: ParB/RepB/Spo0J family partition protein [Gammaproteobacteria bacterium]